MDGTPALAAQQRALRVFKRGVSGALEPLESFLLFLAARFSLSDILAGFLLSFVLWCDLDM